MLSIDLSEPTVYSSEVAKKKKKSIGKKLFHEGYAAST